jgi:hypothetical protein
VNTLSAPLQQSLAGTNYAFSSWSDGGAATHNITANQNATYTATYTQTGGGGSGYRSAVLADAPASYWRVGEASGVSALDEVGGRNGSYQNTPTLGAPGALTGDSNTAVGLNGTNEYVEVPYSGALNPASFSLEAWAYPTGGSGSFRSVISSRDYSASGPLVRGYMLYASSANVWELWLGTGTGFVKLIGPTVTLNSWTHIVATYDGTTARLYLNGTLAASGNLAYSPNTSRPLRLGAGKNETNSDYEFPGRLDELAIYPTALTDTRVQAHYQAGTSP